eukprot:768280-Hanusia_phi.AAC.2
MVDPGPGTDFRLHRTVQRSLSTVRPGTRRPGPGRPFQSAAAGPRQPPRPGWQPRLSPGLLSPTGRRGPGRPPPGSSSGLSEVPNLKLA